jgi:hypothetical protein
MATVSIKYLNLMILALVLVGVMYFIYKKNNIEYFSDDGYSFLELNPIDYPKVANTYFMDNMPVSNDNIIGVYRGGKFCHDDRILVKRQLRDVYQQCKEQSDTLNKVFFTVNVDATSQQYKDTVTEKSKEYDENVLNKKEEHIDKLITEYKNLQEEIMFAKEFEEQNNEYSDKLKKINKNTLTEINEHQNEINKNHQQTLIYDRSQKKMNTQISNIKKYIKYAIGILGVMTVIYLFKKEIYEYIDDANNNNNNNNNNRRNRIYIN